MVRCTGRTQPARPESARRHLLFGVRSKRQEAYTWRSEFDLVNVHREGNRAGPMRQCMEKLVVAEVPAVIAAWEPWSCGNQRR